MCAAIILLLFSCARPTQRQITILHTNDIHSHVEELAALGKTVDAQRELAGDVLLLDAGDVFSGTPYFTLFGGEPMAMLMNQMRYDAMALGNHEFDLGPERLAEFIDMVEFQVLCANFDFSQEEALKGKIKPWAVFEKNSIKIGVIGLNTEETRYVSRPGPNIKIHDVFSQAEKYVSILSDKGVDLIIALTHLGWDTDLLLGERVRGIDIIIGAHSHTRPDVYPYVIIPSDSGNGPKEQKRVLLAHAGEYACCIGRLDVKLDDNGRITAWEGRLIKSAKKPEGVYGEITEFYSAGIAELKQRKVGYSKVKLIGDRDAVRSRETNAGNIVADSLLARSRDAGARIAFYNSGGIRSSIEAGAVVYSDIMEMLPFDNYIVVLEIKGQEINDILEHSVSAVEDSSGRFLQVGGIRFGWDPLRAPGERIDWVKVDTGGEYKNLNPEKYYLVVTNSFLAAGGDGYDILATVRRITEIRVPEYDILADYISAKSAVNPKIKGRIVRIDGNN